MPSRNNKKGRVARARIHNKDQPKSLRPRIDIWKLIFDYCNTQTLVSCLSTCKGFNYFRKRILQVRRQQDKAKAAHLHNAQHKRRLPMELWSQVAYFLDLKELQRVSLVSRDLYDAASAFRFRQLRVYPFMFTEEKNEVQYSRKISWMLTHAQVLGSVEAIIYDPLSSLLYPSTPEPCLELTMVTTCAGLENRMANVSLVKVLTPCGFLSGRSHPPIDAGYYQEMYNLSTWMMHTFRPLDLIFSSDDGASKTLDPTGTAESITIFHQDSRQSPILFSYAVLLDKFMRQRIQHFSTLIRIAFKLSFHNMIHSAISLPPLQFIMPPKLQCLSWAILNEDAPFHVNCPIEVYVTRKVCCPTGLSNRLAAAKLSNVSFRGGLEGLNRSYFSATEPDSTQWQDVLAHEDCTLKA